MATARKVPDRNAIQLVDNGALETMADEIRRLHGAEIKPLERPRDGALVAILPADKRVEDLMPLLAKYLKQPLRRTGTATFFDTKSLIAFVNRFAGEQSVVFADPNDELPSFTAVIDYHEQSENAAEANWLGHRGIYQPRFSDEWEAWREKDGETMAQGDFAAFVEDRIQDVTVPHLDDDKLNAFAQLVQGKWAEPSDLINVSRSLAISVETRIKNAVTLNTGEIKLVFEETQTNGAGAPVSVANLFMLAIPVFYGGPAYRIPVRLRFRVSGERVLWTYLMHRPDLVLDAAFREMVDAVETDTGKPVLLGAPEK